MANIDFRIKNLVSQLAKIEIAQQKREESEKVKVWDVFLSESQVMVPLDGVVYLSTTCYLYIQGSHWVDIDHNVVDVLEILLWIIFAKISLAAL